MQANRTRSLFVKTIALTLLATVFSAPVRPVFAQQPGDPHLHFADAIIPKPAGPGIAILEPITTGVDADTGAFGEACERWLQFRLGDYPELGQMPRWPIQKSLAAEMGLKDSRLTAEAAAPFAAACGYTHFAVGAIVGNADSCTLTYRVYACRVAAPIGEPIRVSGSRRAITAALPEMLRSILHTINVSPTRLPPTPDLSPEEMVNLGRFPQGDSFAHVEAMVSREPLAALLSLNYHIPPRADAAEYRFDTLMKLAPGNLTALSMYAESMVNLPQSLKAKIFQAVPQVPNNGLAALFSYLASRTRQDLLTRAEHWVESAPLDARAWGRLAFEYNGYADYIRRGRFANQITQDEWTVLNRLYSRAVSAAHMSVKLDPHYGDGWLQLSKTSTFASMPKEADEALWKAMSLKKVLLGCYLWGLEIYQPKWFDDPDKLKKVATLGVADTNLTPADLGNLANELHYLGFTELAKKAHDRMIALCKSDLQKDPFNTYERNFLAIELLELKRNEESLVESRKNVEMDPTSDTYLSTLGYAYFMNSDYNSAMGPLREALRLQPRQYMAMTVIGMALQVQGDLDGAESRYREALSISPYYYHANYGLASVMFEKKRYDDAFKQFDVASNTAKNRGEPYAMRSIIYSLQNKEAFARQFAQRAFEMSPDSEVAYTAAGIVLCASQHMAEGLQTLHYAIKLDPTSSRPHLVLGKILANSGKRAEAEAEFKTVVRLSPLSSDGKEAQELLKGQK